MKRRTPQGQNGTSSGVRAPIGQLSKGWGAQSAQTLRKSVSREVDTLDLAERHLEEAGAELAKGVRVARAEEPIRPLFIAALVEPGLLQHALRGRRDGMPCGDQPHVPPQHPL